MTFEQKKEHILRCVRLGMELYQAALMSACTPDEITILENDIEFKQKIEVQHALEEYDLLQKHNVAIETASFKGNASPIQWKLSRINKNRWDNGKESDTTSSINPSELTINLIGKGTDEDT